MNVYIYSQFQKMIEKSGVGRAMYHQKKALEREGVQVVDRKEDADVIRSGHEPMIREYRKTVRIFREWQNGRKDIETQEQKMGGADR